MFTSSYWYSQIIRLIACIPESIWVAITASSITLIGVFLSNRSAHYQQLIVLQHDALQRDREREMSLKREVYLPAIEALNNRINILCHFANLNIPYEDIACENERGITALAKVDAIGNDSTVQAIAEISYYYLDLYLEFTLKRNTLINRKNEIELMDELISRSISQKDRYIEIMRQMNISGEYASGTWDRIGNLLKIEDDLQENFSKKREQLWDIQNRENLDYFEFCLEHLQIINQLIPPVIFAIREELELPTNKDKYMQIFIENYEKSKSRLLSCINKIRETIED